SSIAKRRSHLNAALGTNEENSANAEYLGLMSVYCWLGCRISISSDLGLPKSCFSFLCGLGFLFQKPIYLLKARSVALSFQKSS
ncbi:hypothetical protein, partial [Vibrio parahaemolyticus]|uniref:hypothetical protein n=1 Tax=Vibrio parahaemolyticus TaxID=670 RepID=UPI0004A26A9E